MLAAGNDPLSHVVQHEIIPGFFFTNHMLMMFAAGGLMLWLFPKLAAQKGMVPTGLRNMVEAVCVFLREDMARPVLGQNTDKFIPYIWNLFFFILFMNLLGMIPFDAVISLLTFGKLKVHLGGTATSNIWVTGGLAFLSFVMIHVNGVRENGALHYLKSFVPPVPVALVPFIFLLEIISAIIKPCALAIRLFANMVAGHTILAVLTGLGVASGSFLIGGTTIVASTLFSLLELLVAFIQAYIFTFLTVMFLGAALHPEH